MSDSESTNTSDDNNKREPPSTIIEALLYLCISDELSITTLKETINRPGLSPVYNGRYDYRRDPNKTLSILHHACYNKNVTLEIIQFLLNNSIKCFPDAAQVLSTEFSTRQGDETSIFETYPLHVACGNENCPSDVIRLLIEQYPPACEHLSNINEGIYDDNEVAGLPLHYYLAQNKNVDIDIVKLLVEAYPQSLMITDEEDEEKACYPIHALLSNKKTNNIHTIVEYLLEYNTSSLKVLNGNGTTPLNMACQSKRVNLVLVELLFNAWPEAIQMTDGSGWLPIHDLCNNKKIDNTVALDILQFMLDTDPNLPKVSTDDGGIGGYLPIHLAVDSMSTEFCKVLIKAYPESVRIRSDDDTGSSLPIHEACRFGDRDDTVDTIQYLLELYPESINARNVSGDLPIHLAAETGRNKTIELLLKHDPEAALKKTDDERERLPLHLASEYGHLGATKGLYDACPQAIFQRDANGETPIEIAEERGHRGMKRFLQAQILYARKAQDLKVMTTMDNNGWLPLHHALRDNAPLGSIKLLVEGNLSALRTADSRMAFPLHVACEFSSIKVVRYLVEEHDGIPIHQIDMNKDSTLHHACRGRNLRVIKYLMKNHASLIASAKVNGNSELPIHLLCEAGKSGKDERKLYVETIWLMLLADPEALMS